MTRFKQEPEAYLNKTPRRKDYHPIAYDLIYTNNFQSVLDIGCASGDFLGLLNSKEIKCFGVDISEDLITEANLKNESINKTFLCADFLTDFIEFNTDIDFVTCFGTAVTIDNLELLLRKIFELKPKMIMFNEVINTHKLDITCGYKRKMGDAYNFAYNIRCFDTWSELCSKLGSYSIRFEPYRMTSQLLKTDNPIRNWHATIDGEDIQTNGLGLVLNHFNIYMERMA